MRLPTPRLVQHYRFGAKVCVMESYEVPHGEIVLTENSRTWDSELNVSDEVSIRFEAASRSEAVDLVLGMCRLLEAGPCPVPLVGKVLSWRGTDLPAIVMAKGVLPDVGEVMVTACDHEWEPGDSWGGDAGDALAKMLPWFPNVVAPRREER